MFAAEPYYCPDDEEDNARGSQDAQDISCQSSSSICRVEKGIRIVPLGFVSYIGKCEVQRKQKYNKRQMEDGRPRCVRENELHESNQ